LKGLAPALMYVLTEEYKNYRLYGLQEPEIITNHTEEFRKMNDPLEQFIQQNMQEDKTSVVSVDVLYNNFKDWFDKMFPNNRVMNSQSFRQDIKKHGYSINSLDQIVGIKIISYF